MVKKYLVDTTDADDESQLWLGWDVGIAVGLGLSLAGDQVALGLGVLLGVSGGALDDGAALEDAGLLGVLLGQGALGKGGLVQNALLLQGFWDGGSHCISWDRFGI